MPDRATVERGYPPPPGPSSDPSKEVRPIPDPTVLTTQQMLRENAMLRELIESRLDGMDKAILIRHENVEKLPEIIEGVVGHLQALHEEKFSSIATQFRERDTRTDQMARDSKVAVDAALQAAKEAVGEQNKSSALAIAKSEAATMKQMDQIALMLTSAVNGLNDKIDDMKERISAMENRAALNVGEARAYDPADVRLRLAAIESVAAGGAGAIKGSSDSWKAMAAIGTIAVAVLAIVASIVIAITLHTGK